MIERPKPLGTIAMAVEHLRDLLCRAHAGEDPEILLAEEYANADHGSLREWIDRHEKRPPPCPTT